MKPKSLLFATSMVFIMLQSCTNGKTQENCAQLLDSTMTEMNGRITALTDKLDSLTVEKNVSVENLNRLRDSIEDANEARIRLENVERHVQKGAPDPITTGTKKH